MESETKVAKKSPYIFIVSDKLNELLAKKVAAFRSPANADDPKTADVESGDGEESSPKGCCGCVNVFVRLGALSAVVLFVILFVLFLTFAFAQSSPKQCNLGNRHRAEGGMLLGGDEAVFASSAALVPSTRAELGGSDDDADGDGLDIEARFGQMLNDLPESNNTGKMRLFP